MQIAGILAYLVSFAIMAGIYAVFCLGLNIQWGYTGLFNIGIAAGAWVGGRLLDSTGLHANLWAAAVLAASALLMVATTRR